MKRYLFVLMAFLCFSACSNNEQNTQEALRKEVIGVHDEIMPRMREIGELKEQLQSIEDELVEGNGEDVSEKIALIQRASESLSFAEDAMRTWMQEFKFEIPEDLEHDQVMDYLGKEMDKINTVKAQILQSVDSTQQLIEQLAKP